MQIARKIENRRVELKKAWDFCLEDNFKFEFIVVGRRNNCDGLDKWLILGNTGIRE